MQTRKIYAADKLEFAPSSESIKVDYTKKRALIVSESKFSGLAIRSVLSDTFPVIHDITLAHLESNISLAGFSVIVIVDFATIEKVFWVLDCLETNMGDLSCVVVVLRDDHEPAMLQEFLWKVAAVVPASVPLRRIAEITDAICDGFSILPSYLVRYLVQSSPEFRQRSHQILGLTSQEWRIIDLLAIGQSNKFIADALSVSDGTIRVHIRNIVNKLGATNRTHAALLAAGIGVAGAARGGKPG